MSMLSIFVKDGISNVMTSMLPINLSAPVALSSSGDTVMPRLTIQQCQRERRQEAQVFMLKNGVEELTLTFRSPIGLPEYITL